MVDLIIYDFNSTSNLPNYKVIPTGTHGFLNSEIVKIINEFPDAIIFIDIDYNSIDSIYSYFIK